MAVRFKISKGRKKTFLKLPLSFLEHFLPCVNGDYLKIYLYGLEACLEKRSLQDREIASALGVLPADVGNAWRFWEEKGVVFQTADGSVEFINPEELDFSEGDMTEKPLPAAKNNDFDEIFKTAQKDPAFRKTIVAIESVYPNLLTQNDVASLYDIVVSQGISADLFLITAAHCFKMKKNRFNYIAKVLTETYKKGYTTPETMELYYASLSEANEAVGRVKKILKIYGRDLSDKEREYVDAWLKSDKTEDDIKEAFEKTVLNTGKLSFPYMDKILSAEKGNNVQSRTSLKTGPLNNFNQEMPDFKSIEDMLWERQNKH